mmetsp:Transcript_24396/g.58006  ORF Transcript_24396/g.58006 Transcript_24396/m.58006 type:complete len:234 (+) Transcript_24396:1410-2111(+)
MPRGFVRSTFANIDPSSPSTIRSILLSSSLPALYPFPASEASVSPRHWDAISLMVVEPVLGVLQMKSLCRKGLNPSDLTVTKFDSFLGTDTWLPNSRTGVSATLETAAEEESSYSWIRSVSFELGWEGRDKSTSSSCGTFVSPSSTALFRTSDIISFIPASTASKNKPSANRGNVRTVLNLRLPLKYITLSPRSFCLSRFSSSTLPRKSSIDLLTTLRRGLFGKFNKGRICCD